MWSTQFGNSATFLIKHGTPADIVSTVETQGQTQCTAAGTSVLLPIAAIDAFDNHCSAASFADLLEISVDDDDVTVQVVIEQNKLQLRVTSNVCAECQVTAGLPAAAVGQRIRWSVKWTPRVPQLPSEPRPKGVNRLGLQQLKKARGAAGCFNRETATPRAQPLTWRPVPREPSEPPQPRGAITARPAPRRKLPVVLIGRAPV